MSPTKSPELDLNPDGGLETLVDLRIPVMDGGDSSLTGVPSIILDPQQFRLERMMTRQHLVYGVPTPFVGRRDELETAYNVVRDAVTLRSLRTIGIVGGAGAGKTRLLSELFAIMEPDKRGMEVFAGCCSESESPDGIALIGQLLRRRFELGAQDAEAVVRDKVREAIRHLVPGTQLDSAAGQLAYLLGMAATGSDPESPREVLRYQHLAMTTFYNLTRYHAVRAPQILVIHRTRFLTPRAQAILEGLLEALATTPTIIFLLGDVPTQQELRKASPGHTELKLGPLSEPDVERLVLGILARVAPTPPVSMVDDLVARAAGNPRLVEDNIRLLVQRRVLIPGEQVWEVAQTTAASRVELPRSTDDAARERVAGLAEDVRAVLSLASVFGAAAWVEGVLTLLYATRSGSFQVTAPWADDGGAAWVEGVLQRAIEDGLVTLHDRSALEGRREFAFAKRSDRQLLYDELPEADRATYHRLAGQWFAGLELRDPTPWYEVVAEHLELGGRLERAARWYTRAARAARVSYNMGRAQGLYRRALALVDVDRIDLLLPILEGFGEAHYHGGEFTMARRACGALLEASLIAHDRATGSRAWLMLGRCHRALGDYKEARACFDHAFSLFQKDRNTAGIADALDQIARLLRIEGNGSAYAEALSHLREALELRRQVGDRRAIANSLEAIASTYLQQGRSDEAESGLAEALELRRAVGDRAGEASALGNLGLVRHSRGDLDGAVDAWRAGLEIASQIGDRELLGIFMNNIGEACLQRGETKLAKNALVEARQITTSTGDQRTLADVHRNLGALAVTLGQWERALKEVDEAIRICESLGARVALGQALRTRGEILGHQLYADETPTGRHATDATTCFEQSIELLEAVGDVLELERSLQAYSRYLAEHGELARAEVLAGRAEGLRVG